MAEWYYAGPDKTGHKCPYCCDAFVSGAGCELICVADGASTDWTCIPPPTDICFVYEKDYINAPYSISIVWNSRYFGASQNLGCYPSSLAPPCVNSAGWSVIGSAGGGCSGVAYSGLGDCGGVNGCHGCSQTTANIRTACSNSSSDVQSCGEDFCYIYTGANTYAAYCKSCNSCSVSQTASCSASCDTLNMDCYATCFPECDWGFGGYACPPFYHCEYGTCVEDACNPVTGASDCGLCATLACTEDESGDIGYCVSDSAPSCDANHYLSCTCNGWECLCSSGYSACCGEVNADGDTQGQTGWNNVSHGRCRPCWWPYVSSGTDCCSKNGGDYRQKHCSSIGDGCCPDGRCYDYDTVVCRRDLSTGYSVPCGEAELDYP